MSAVTNTQVEWQFSIRPEMDKKDVIWAEMDTMSALLGKFI